MFAAFAKAQHLDNSDYNLLSAFVPGEIVAHSYHYFSVEYEKDPSLVIIVSTYSKRSASAVCSAQNFDIALLPEKDFDTRVLTFLETHFTVCVEVFPFLFIAYFFVIYRKWGRNFRRQLMISLRVNSNFDVFPGILYLSHMHVICRVSSTNINSHFQHAVAIS